MAIRQDREFARISYSGGPPNDPTDDREELIETPATRRETNYISACERYFERLLQEDANPVADPTETNQQPPLNAKALCSELQHFGMGLEVTEDELCSMLKASGYADEDGTLDFERFMVLAKDLKLIESKKASTRNRGKKNDLGRLGEFFEILDAGEENGFSREDFVDALRVLSTDISAETADKLLAYVYMPPDVKLSFKEFETYYSK